MEGRSVVAGLVRRRGGVCSGRRGLLAFGGGHCASVLLLLGDVSVRHNVLPQGRGNARLRLFNPGKELLRGTYHLHTDLL